VIRNSFICYNYLLLANKKYANELGTNYEIKRSKIKYVHRNQKSTIQNNSFIQNSFIQN